MESVVCSGSAAASLPEWMRDPSCLGARRLRRIARQVGSDVLARAVAGLDRRSRLAWLAALPGGFRAMVEDEVCLLRQTLTAVEFAAATASARGLVLTAALELAESMAASAIGAGCPPAVGGPGQATDDTAWVGGEGMPTGDAELPTGWAAPLAAMAAGPTTAMDGPPADTGRHVRRADVPWLDADVPAIHAGADVVPPDLPWVALAGDNLPADDVGWQPATTDPDAAAEDRLGPGAPALVEEDESAAVVQQVTTESCRRGEPAVLDAERVTADLAAALASTDGEARLWHAQTRVALGRYPLSRCALPRLAEILVVWGRLADEDPLLLDDLLPLVDDAHVQAALRLVSSLAEPDLVQTVLDRQGCAALVDAQVRQAITIEGLRCLDDRDHPATVRARLQSLAGARHPAVAPTDPVAPDHLQQRLNEGIANTTHDWVDLFVAMAGRLRREGPATHWDRRLLSREQACSDIVRGKVGRYTMMGALAADVADPLLRHGLAQLAAGVEPTLVWQALRAQAQGLQDELRRRYDMVTAAAVSMARNEAGDRLRARVAAFLYP